MRYVTLLISVTLLLGCSKTDGERCVENYMEMHNEMFPKDSPAQNRVMRQQITAHCTDPHIQNSN